MSPLPGWMVGGQSVALNFSNNDLAVQLNFALFNGAGGFVLKPAEMRPSVPNPSEPHEGGDDSDALWPPAHSRLHRASVEIVSLHNLPKRGERRPRYAGSRSACHDYHVELSGEVAPPDDLEPSWPSVQISLHPIGGFCTISTKKPLRENHGTQYDLLPAISGGGMNVAYNQTVHCVAAQPYATFVRVSVTDRGQETAYETAVLGRLRRGYRVFHMRSLLGTRIELCYLFVKISFGTERNLWLTPRDVRMLVSQQEQLRESRTSCAGCVDADEQRVTQREAQLSRLTQRSSVGMKV